MDFDPITITANRLRSNFPMVPQNLIIQTSVLIRVQQYLEQPQHHLHLLLPLKVFSYYYVVVSGILWKLHKTSDLTGAYIVSPSGTAINLDLDPTAPDQEFCFGAVSFSQLEISATGDGGVPATYQWYQNTTPTNTGGVLISGENEFYFHPSF
jgi:hypothetical protein